MGEAHLYGIVPVLSMGDILSVMHSTTRQVTQIDKGLTIIYVKSDNQSSLLNLVIFIVSVLKIHMEM